MLIFAPPLAAEQPASGASAPVRMLQEVARLQQPSNQLRREALAALLREHDIAFSLQAFPCPGCGAQEDGSHYEGGTNFIVEIGAGERDLIIGAHYDAVRLTDGTLSAGMVDNGAAVVILLHLAKTLAGLDLTHRVRIVFFDMEEQGMVGSRHFVGSLNPTRVAAAINLDVVAAGDTVVFGPLTQEAGAASLLVTALGTACLELGVGFVDFQAFPPGDDISFRLAGIPILSIALLPRHEAHQLWLLLNHGAASGLRPGFMPRTVEIIHSPADALALVQPEALSRAHEVLVRMVPILDAGLAGGAGSNEPEELR